MTAPVYHISMHITVTARQSTSLLVTHVSVTAHRDCWKISYTPAYYGMPYKNPHVIIACRSLAEAQNQISVKPHF